MPARSSLGGPRRWRRKPEGGCGTACGAPSASPCGLELSRPRRSGAAGLQALQRRAHSAERRERAGGMMPPPASREARSRGPRKPSLASFDINRMTQGGLRAKFRSIRHTTGLPDTAFYVKARETWLLSLPSALPSCQSEQNLAFASGTRCGEPGVQDESPGFWLRPVDLARRMTQRRMTQDGDNVISSDGPEGESGSRGAWAGDARCPRLHGDASRLARPLPTAARDRDGSVQLACSWDVPSCTPWGTCDWDAPNRTPGACRYHRPLTVNTILASGRSTSPASVVTGSCTSMS